ncbi:hypothetical protein [Bartonella grahamii]|uniref:Uncharacterized protein n=1 Tax=Bartonella grahamii TaxID=33045 RepID=A0A336NA33_BARGR|nr:Uncharacterised protein [Bartonella grahamii]
MRYLRFQQWLTKMKVTTDKGNASKEEMIKTVYAKGHALQDHLENSLLAKANLVRKAVLNTREKRLKEKAMRENSRPLTLVEKQKLEGILNGLGGTVKNIAG